VTTTFRDLTTLEDYAQVVELERVIWGPGYDDVVPVPILAVTVLRGAILIGAFDVVAPDRLVGFVYSVAGLKHGRAMQWSHMLGVIDEFRNDGLGYQLKILQRERALAMGLDLIEWTYDPMQAMNAHLNFSKLGVVVEEYEVNVYGTSNSPLHAGNPTDRFVAEWRIREPHVERRLVVPPKGSLGRPRADDLSDAKRANALRRGAQGIECVDVDLALTSRRVVVTIPVGFTEMLVQEPQLALEWRLATRGIFQAYFARGYQVVDFVLDRAAGSGAYLLAQKQL